MDYKIDKLLYFVHDFISRHITIYNRYYLLFSFLVLKITCVIISVT